MQHESSLKSACNKCIQETQSCVDACQKLIPMCAPVSEETKCAKQLALTADAGTQAIQACKECINHCNVHLQECSDEECCAAVEHCIKSCNANIEHIQSMIDSCKGGKEDCAQTCISCINVCKECIDSCKALLECCCC